MDTDGGPETVDEHPEIEPLAIDRLEGSVSLRPGQHLGRYVLMRELGSGGMGVVYEAYDPKLERRAALKVLHAAHSNSPRSDDESRRLSERLVREGQALARLHSQHVPAVYDVGLINERPFIATEFVAGRSMAFWLSEARRSWREVLEVALQAAAGLQAAHETGLVHRDVKPDNVLIGNDGTVRVADFGLVTSVHVHETGSDVQRPLPEPTAGQRFVGNITRFGSVLGTPAYMSPEQRRGAAADAKSDQYSFCLTVFEAIFGDNPFGIERRAVLGADEEDRAFDQVFRKLRSRWSGVPGWLRAGLARGLARDPEARFASMAELLATLERGRERQRRGKIAAGGGLMIAALMAAGPLVRTEQNGPKCSPEASLSEVWNESRREAIETAFFKLGSPLAHGTWALLAPKLDAYVEQWRSSFAEVCARSVAGDTEVALRNDRSQACLRTRLGAFAELTRVYESPDESVLKKAVDAADDLPSVSTCVDGDDLRDVEGLPHDAEDRKRLEEYVVELARLTMAWEAGRGIDEIRQRLHRLERGANDLDSGTLRTRVALLRAQTERGFPRLRAFERALRLAISDGLDEIAAEAAIECAFLLGVNLGEVDAANEHLDHAMAFIRATGDLPELRHRFDIVLGITHHLRGDRPKQLGLYQTALERARQTWGADLSKVQNFSKRSAFHTEWRPTTSPRFDHFGRASPFGINCEAPPTPLHSTACTPWRMSTEMPES